MTFIHSHLQFIRIVRCVAALGMALTLSGVAAGAERIDFNRDIRPILASKCYACHGPDEDKREADLRLDTEAGAKRDLGGYAAIVPGKPDESELWKRVTTTDRDDVMPPPSSPKQLAESERALLRRWINEGAPYQEHWSFLPVRTVQPPPADRETAGAANAIDLFVRHELGKQHIQAAREADAATLIRRVSLDLTGLPPTPEESAEFVWQQLMVGAGSGAYEQLVDRLLASPQFGERWGRHWLDLARYADSDGFLGDKVRSHAWLFRDWVIDAINRDLPFDQFTIEQIAGDLLPDAGIAQLTATGFHRNAALNTEAGVDKEEARFQNIADRVNTTGRVWLGLTVGCAQCHTHKYDPITIRDYYSLYAFFNNTQDRDEPKTKAQALAEIIQHRRETYVHLTGSYARRGPTVLPASLSALPPITAEENAGNTQEWSRLDLARWLVAPNHPLTSRVAVNHIWSKLFGVGIVSTPDDFGATGEPPSHPELLDWLAHEFMRNGWSRKKLIRLIVTSATYRQSSAHRPELVEIDPLNRLLARQNRLRLEAEVLRDAFLKTSGLLTNRIGGPSIRPPLPGDVFDVGRSVKWEVEEGAERYRRGFYILTLRSVLYPMLTTFDAPDASDACVRRERSNTPLQALTLMNDPVFVEAAQAMAARVMRESAPNAAARLRHLFGLCLAREPRDEEIARLGAFYAEQKVRINAGGQDALSVLGSLAATPKEEDAVETATFVALARVLMNLDEFINRE